MEPVTDRRALERGVAAAALALGVASVVSMVWIVVASHHPLPVWDEWLMLVQMEPALEHGLGPRLLLRHLYEHLVASQRLAAYADYTLFDGRNVLPKAANFVVQGLHALLFVLLLRPGAAHGAAAPGLATCRWLAAAGLAVTFLFSARHTVVLRSGFQFTMVSTLAAVTLAAACYAAAAGGARGAAPRRRAGWLLGALAAGLAASCSFGSGLLVWPALLGCGLLARAPWPVLATPVAGLALSLGAHAVDPVPAGHAAVLAPLLERPGLVAARGLALVGTPLGELGVAVGLAFGVLGTAAGVGVLAWMLRRRPGRVGLVCTALLLFLGGSLVLAASARSNLGLDQAFKERYGLFAMLYWLALLLAWWQRRGRVPARPRRAGDAVAAAVVAVLLLASIAAHVDKVRDAERWPVHFRHGADALLAGVDDWPLLVDIGLKKRRVREGDAVLRRHGLSIYRDGLHRRLGAPLDEVFARAPAERCLGTLLDTSAVADGVRLLGWAWDRDAARVPRRLLVTDARGRLAGFGSSGERRRRIPAKFPEVESLYSGWLAYARGEPPYRVHALLADGRVCELGVG